MNGMNETGGWGQPGVPGYDPAETVKAARKQFSMLGRMFLAGTVVIYVVQIGVAQLVMMLKPEWLTDMNAVLMLSVVPMYLVGMPLLILFVKQVPADKVERRPMKAGSFVVAAIMCFAIVYLSNLAGNIMTWVIGNMKGSMIQNEIADVATSVSIWMVLIYMVLCAPIMEEYVFRKLIVDRTVRYGQGAAVLVSGLMFGLFHGNLNQFVYAFTLGMFLAFLYVKTGNLKITIALHMMINFMGGVVSTLLLKLVDLDTYMQLIESGSFDKLQIYMREHLVLWLAYLLFLFFVIGMMVAGGILLIVFLATGKFALAKGRAALPRGKRFSTVMLNVGMILYCIFWIAMIIWQMFGDEIMMIVRRLMWGQG